MAIVYTKEVIPLRVRVFKSSILLDEEDFVKYQDIGCSFSTSGYVLLNFPGSDQRFLHKEVMNAGKGQLVDHLNRNLLDNRKTNLRLATVSQNAMNKISSSASGFKGVTWDAGRNKWKAHIEYQGSHKNLGRFSCKIEAAKAYDAAAIRLFGKFARLNFGEIK